MDETRMVTIIFGGKPRGRMKEEMPRLRWLEDGENDLRERNVNA